MNVQARSLVSVQVGKTADGRPYVAYSPRSGALPVALKQELAAHMAKHMPPKHAEVIDDAHPDVKHPEHVFVTLLFPRSKAPYKASAAADTWLSWFFEDPREELAMINQVPQQPTKRNQRRRDRRAWKNDRLMAIRAGSSQAIQL